jgi:hypothetical protein
MKPVIKISSFSDVIMHLTENSIKILEHHLESEIDLDKKCHCNNVSKYFSVNYITTVRCVIVHSVIAYDGSSSVYQFSDRSITLGAPHQIYLHCGCGELGTHSFDKNELSESALKCLLCLLQ